MEKIIKLTKGYAAIIDEEDYENVSQYNWCAFTPKGGVYAVTRIGGEFVYLHRFLMGASDPKDEIDHIDGNGLNCQRSNLRLATHKQNMCNRKKSKNAKVKYTGVSKSGNKYRASITKDGKSIHLGVFVTAERAAHHYNLAAIELFGEFARLNELPNIKRVA